MTLTIPRCRIGIVTVLLAATLALLAEPAHAGDPQRAKEMFQQGSVYFDLGQFDKAIDVWQRGYEEKQDPGFLYNIAQAYRLSNDPRKAVFFYKSFLRNSPEAPNRREIEQKIAAQEKLIAAEERGKPGASAPASGPDTKTPSAVPTIQSAGAAPTTMQSAAPADQATPIAPTSPTSPSSNSLSEPALKPDVALPSAVVVADAAPAVAAGAPNSGFDIGAAVGGNAWMSGVRGTASPSLAVTATFGYTFSGADAGRTRFHLGGLVGYTFLSDVGSRATFFSALIDPGLRIRVSAERLYLTADLGIGVVAIAGLDGASALLAQGAPVTVNGTQSLFEVRPGVGIEYRLRPSLAAFGGAAIAYSPKRTYFYAPLTRLDLLLGLVLRL